MIIGEETAYADIRILKRREKVKQKRHFIVSTLELQIDFQIFQNKEKRWSMYSTEGCGSRRAMVQTAVGEGDGQLQEWT